MGTNVTTLTTSYMCVCVCVYKLGPWVGMGRRVVTHLGGPRLDGGNAGRVDQGLGPPSRLLDQALPLAGQPCELLLMLVEASVHTVLEVGGR